MLFSIDPEQQVRFDSGGFLREGRGYRHIHRDRLDNTEVFLIEEGTLFIEANKTPTVAKPGTVLIHPPGTMQDGSKISPDPLKYLWFHCTIAIDSDPAGPVTEGVRSILANPPELYGVATPKAPTLIVPDQSTPRRWGALLHLAYSICENRPCFSCEKDGLVAAFFSSLSADYLLSGLPVSKDAPTPQIAKVKEYIDHHVDNKFQVKQLSIPHIATHFDLHPDYLNRLFKKETGMSIHAYIMERRMVLACRLLSMGWSVEPASRHAGFGNPEYFARAFRKAMRCTPSEYRRNSRSY